MSSPLSLVYDDSSCRIAKVSLSNAALSRYESFLRVPTKACINYFTLSEVHGNPRLKNGDYLDILAAVSFVCPIKTIMTRTGAEKQTREVTLFDQTNNYLILKLWDYDLLHMVERLQPMKDVLFLADVRVDYENFRSVTHQVLATYNL